MPHEVDFKTVSTTGLESSPVAEALAGLRAKEGRDFSTKDGHPVTGVAGAGRPDPPAATSGP